MISEYRILLPAAVAIAIGLGSLPVGLLAPHDLGSGGLKAEEKAEAVATTKPAECDACHMGMEHMKSMAKLKELLEEAKGEAEKENATKTVEKIDKALKVLEERHHAAHKRMKHHMRHCPGSKEMMKGDMKCPVCGKMMGPGEEGKVVNAHCPITGKKIDPHKVPQDLTREWKGQKIGFCCPGCPPAWDKLSEEEKQKKLDAAMAESPKAEKPAEHGK